MPTFVTAHDGSLHVNCERCGHHEPLGLGFDADDDVIEEATDLWEVGHQCQPITEYGLREFPNAEKSARYFGLPDDYR